MENKKTQQREMRESKICPICKRSFNNRKKWASRGLWPSIRFCSQRCRREASKKS